MSLQDNEDFIELVDIQFAVNNKTDMVIRICEKSHQDIHDVDKADNQSVGDDLNAISYYFYIKHEPDSSGNLNVQMIEDKG